MLISVVTGEMFGLIQLNEKINKVIELYEADIKSRKTDSTIAESFKPGDTVVCTNGWRYGQEVRLPNFVLVNLYIACCKIYILVGMFLAEQNRRFRHQDFLLFSFSGNFTGFEDE